MIDLDLDRWDALVKAATPGPWGHDGGTGWTAAMFHQWVEHDCCGQFLNTGECCGSGFSQTQKAWSIETFGTASPSDAAFIVAARDAVPAMIARIRELEGALSEIAELEELPFRGRGAFGRGAVAARHQASELARAALGKGGK